MLNLIQAAKVLVVWRGQEHSKLQQARYEQSSHHTLKGSPQKGMTPQTGKQCRSHGPTFLFFCRHLRAPSVPCRASSVNQSLLTFVLEPPPLPTRGRLTRSLADLPAPTHLARLFWNAHPFQTKSNHKLARRYRQDKDFLLHLVNIDFCARIHSLPAKEVSGASGK